MKKEKIKLFRDLLLVRPLPPEDKTFGGLIIPKDAQEELRYLEVLEIGPGVHGIKKGDHIVTIGQHPGGQDVVFNGEKLIVMRDKYIGGVMEQKSKK